MMLLLAFTRRVAGLMLCEKSQRVRPLLGWPAVPPAFKADIAPQALPVIRQLSRFLPERYAWTKPASKESPAPVVSREKIGNGGILTTFLPAAPIAPSEPSLMTAQGTSAASRATADFNRSLSRKAQSFAFVNKKYVRFPDYIPNLRCPGFGGIAIGIEGSGQSPLTRLAKQARKTGPQADAGERTKSGADATNHQIRSAADRYS